MKILILTNYIYPDEFGGIEKLAAELSTELARDHEVVVYTSYVEGHPQRETRDGVLVKRFKSADNYRLKVPFAIRTVNILRELKRESPKPDVILSMSLQYGFVCHLAGKVFGIPFMLYILGSDWYIARDKRFQGRLYRFGIRGCGTLITQSHVIEQDILKRFPEATIEVIPNGLTLPEKRSKGDKIVCLGRLVEVKGVRYLIEAVKDIPDCPEVIIAGAGPEEETLKEMAAGLNIRFTGRVLNIENVFMEGGIFILPSLSEGLPQAMLEAMSYGLPVIATTVGGVPDVVEHGRTGFLVEPGNAGEIRKYLERLLSDEVMRKTMSENCLTEIQNYAWPVLLKRMEGAMERLVTRK
ncbi:MAG: glycosyltransferase family 4 protein [bacterium]|nr:glycosyltransferase family 4 protein [bacterium]